MGALAGVAALGLASLGVVAPLASQAQAVRAGDVSFSFGNTPVPNGSDLGPATLGIELGILMVITNNGPNDLSIPQAQTVGGVDAFPTTSSPGLVMVAFSGLAGIPTCSAVTLTAGNSCFVELVVVPVQAGRLTGSIVFGGAVPNFSFTLEGNEGYVTATAGGAAAFFDTFGASLKSNNQPTFVDQKERTLNAPIVGAAATLTGGGYYLAAADGGIFNFGDATFHGSAGSIHLNKPIVGMAGHQAQAGFTDGGIDGYWEVASDGGIFNFGNAHFYGSTGGIHLNKPIVGMAAMSNGTGYWLVASDGGIFTFGNAAFFGSTGSLHLNKPIVGMAATPDGRGYWLVASDGGIFSFGDAHFHGSTGSIHLNQPIIGMAAVPGGGGYWLEARDAGSFTEGIAPYIQSGFTAATFSTVAIAPFGEAPFSGGSGASLGGGSAKPVPEWHGAGVKARA
jgi:hypothetical protein